MNTQGERKQNRKAPKEESEAILQRGYFTNVDEFLGSMSSDDWKRVKAVCEANNLDDKAYKVHPTFCALAKAAWWNGTLELLERAPDMYEGGDETEKYLMAIKTLSFNKRYDDMIIET